MTQNKKMLARIELYNRNHIKVLNDNVVLFEKTKNGEFKQSVIKPDIKEAISLADKVRIIANLKEKDFELFNIIQSNFQDYEILNSEPIGNLEDNPIDFKNGNYFLGKVSNKDIFGQNKTIKDFFNPNGEDVNIGTNFLKFKKGDRTVLFVAQKPVKSHISWDSINGGSSIQDVNSVKSGVYGAMVKEINNQSYKIRLLTGSNNKEWDNSLLALNTHNPSKYNDAYFGTHYHYGDGSASWTQEQYDSNSLFRVIRGGVGVSISSNSSPNDTCSSYAWRPVLELVFE